MLGGVGSDCSQICFWETDDHRDLVRNKWKDLFFFLGLKKIGNLLQSIFIKTIKSISGWNAEWRKRTATQRKLLSKGSAKKKRIKVVSSKFWTNGSFMKEIVLFNK